MNLKREGFGGVRGSARGRGSKRGKHGHPLGERKGGQGRGPVSSSDHTSSVGGTEKKGPVKGCYTCVGQHYAKQCGITKGGEDKKRKANPHN